MQISKNPLLPEDFYSMFGLFYCTPDRQVCDGDGWVAAAHRVVIDTLCVWLGLIRGLTLLSRHHSPSLSIVDEFNILKLVLMREDTQSELK